MRKLYTFALLFALALAAAGSSPTAKTDAAVDNNPTGTAIGAVVADFSAADAGGKEHALSALKGKQATVFIFISVQCPVSNAYNGRMEKLAQEYRERGVNVVGLNSNVSETPEAMKQHAAEKGLTFTVLKDARNRVADQLGAQVTPEAFLLDANNRLVYRGRIDNSRNGDTITSSELREALDAVLAGKPVAKPEVKAFGCGIKRAS